VRYRLVLVLAIQAGGDLVIEGKGVPGKPATWPQRGGGPLERAAPVGPGRQVQQRAERAIDQRGWLGENQVAYVTLAQV
jgi:hypothetical protein